MTGYEWATLRNEGELSPRQIAYLDFLRWRVRTGRLSEGGPGEPARMAIVALSAADEDDMVRAYLGSYQWLR